MYFALIPQAGVKVRAPCRGLNAPPTAAKPKTQAHQPPLCTDTFAQRFRTKDKNKKQNIEPPSQKKLVQNFFAMQ